MIHRIVSLPEKQSFFLFGPRQTGKSTLIQNLYPKSVWVVNLLQNDLFFAYSKDPSLFRKQAADKIKRGEIKTIFIDEVQRLPELLNEVQALMQGSTCQFILTGSSTRKLKRGGANLLAGRARQRFLFPLIFAELGDRFSLEDCLHYGTLPPVWNCDKNKDKEDLLQTYVDVYLREEIQSEGLARNLGGFSRFLDLACSQFGDLLNASAVARDCQVSVKTVQGYYDILEDTLIGFRLMPWRKSLRKQLSAHSKFYFFDCGVTNAINRQLQAGLNPAQKGRLFEQWVLLEVYRQTRYLQSECRMFYWRTNHGAEVDLLIERGGVIVGAFEIKSSATITGAHCSGLRAFGEDNSNVPLHIISSSPHPYHLGPIRVLPWQFFLKNIKDWL